MMMRQSRDWRGGRVVWTGCLLLMLGLVLGSCGGDGDSTDGDGSDDEAGLSSEDLEDLPAEVRAAAESAVENDLMFVTSREELEERAREEGEVRVMSSLEPEQWDAMAERWPEDYPDIAIEVLEYSGTDSRQRLLQELAVGAGPAMDVAVASQDQYQEYAVDYATQFDLMGMSEAGILNIPTLMIDPDLRSVVATGMQAGAIGYNPNEIDESDLPQSYEDLLDPRFGGSPYAFVNDIRPSNFVPMVDAWGVDRMVEYAEGLGQQDPLWARGSTGALTRIAAGEAAFMVFANYDAVASVNADHPDTLKPLLLEPVPTRLSEPLTVFNADIGGNYHAALLFIEWMTGPVGQEILDMDFKAHAGSGHGLLYEALGDLETSEAGFGHFPDLAEYTNRVVEAYGFPTAAFSD